VNFELSPLLSGDMNPWGATRKSCCINRLLLFLKQPQNAGQSGKVRDSVTSSEAKMRLRFVDFLT
jgi:hypothetical protein